MKLLTFKIGGRYYIIDCEQNSLRCLDENGIRSDKPQEHLIQLIFNLVDLLREAADKGSIKISEVSRAG